MVKKQCVFTTNYLSENIINPVENEDFWGAINPDKCDLEPKRWHFGPKNGPFLTSQKQNPKGSLTVYERFSGLGTPWKGFPENVRIYSALPEGNEEISKSCYFLLFLGTALLFFPIVLLFSPIAKLFFTGAKLCLSIVLLLLCYCAAPAMLLLCYFLVIGCYVKNSGSSTYFIEQHVVVRQCIAVLGRCLVGGSDGSSDFISRKSMFQVPVFRVPCS